MDNLLRLGVCCIVFACLGISTPIKEKPPDPSENVTQLSNTAHAVTEDPNKPTTFLFPEKPYPNLPVRKENQTAAQADVNSDRLANLSLQENLFTANDSAHGPDRVTGRNSSVRSESRLSLDAKLGGNSLEKDRLGITLAEVNDSVVQNSSTADNSTLYGSRLSGEQELMYTAKNKTAEHQNYTNLTESADSLSWSSNDSIGNISMNSTGVLMNHVSEEKAGNLSVMAVPFQRANGSAPEPDRGQNLTASPANTTGHAHVVKGQPVEILHAGLANSPYGENVGNWSHPSCVNGNEGLNGTNCSTSGTEDRNLAVTDPVLVNETTRVPAYFPVIHQVNNSGTPLLTEKSFRLTPDQHLSNNSDLSTAVLKSNNSVVRTTNYTTVNVTLFENGTTGSTTTPSGGTRRHKSYVISSQMKQHYKGVMQTILMEELKHGVWESKVPIEDGPFGSLIWRDKKYLISVLVPIGVGITGAVIIVVVAYAVRSYKRKQKRRAFTSPSRTFRPQAQLAIMDQVLLLDDSSDDEF